MPLLHRWLRHRVKVGAVLSQDPPFTYYGFCWRLYQSDLLPGICRDDSPFR